MTEATLAQRIKAEFDARELRAKQSEEAKSMEVRAREERMAKFIEACQELHSVVQPRVEDSAKAFGDQVKITPTITPAERSATVAFMTGLANVTLTVKMAPDPDVTKLVLDYDLLILPMCFECDRHARLEMPLVKIDNEFVAKWLDDRIMSCVSTYLSIHENEYDLRRVMVEDPISKARFLRDDAAGMIEHNGQELHFETAETHERYKQLHQTVV